MALQSTGRFITSQYLKYSILKVQNDFWQQIIIFKQKQWFQAFIRNKNNLFPIKTYFYTTLIQIFIAQQLLTLIYSIIKKSLCQNSYLKQIEEIYSVFLKMKSFCQLLLAFLLCITIISAKQIYMSSVYRHGARYSIYDYYDFNQTKQFAGLLTSVGLREHYLLGSYIQNQYIKSKISLLNTTLNPRQTEFFSLVTQTGRCEQSAYAQALGLFPFGEGGILPQNIDPKLLQPPFQTIYPSFLKVQQAPAKSQFALEYGFQPVPIRYCSQIFPVCPNINVILSSRGKLMTKQIALIQAQYSAFTDKMRVIFNLTAAQANIQGLYQLADTIISDKWLNRDLPNSFSEFDFNQLYFIRSYLFTIFYAGDVSRIINAPYIHSLLDKLQLKIDNKLQQKKFASISVHDSNIIPLLTYYNITNYDCLHKKIKNQTVTGNCADPLSFASNFFFELHQNDSDPNSYFVKARYNGVYYKLFGKNTTEVQFSEFAAKSKSNLLDFNTQCKVKKQLTVESKPQGEGQPIRKILKAMLSGKENRLRNHNDKLQEIE